MHRKVDNFGEQLDKLIAEGVGWQHFSGTANFLKHAARDPVGYLEDFDSERVLPLIGLATLLYRRLCGECSRKMEAFDFWLEAIVAASSRSRAPMLRRGCSRWFAVYDHGNRRKAEVPSGLQAQPTAASKSQGNIQAQGASRARFSFAAGSRPAIPRRRSTSEREIRHYSPSIDLRVWALLRAFDA